MKVTNKLYKGKVILNFNSYGHKYKLGDKVVGGVTNILKVIAKPMLIPWAARMATEYVEGQIKPGESYDEVQLVEIFEKAKKAHWQEKKDAGDIGTLMHAWIEDYINGENPGTPVNEMLQDGVNNFLYWVKEHKVKFLLAEQPSYSKKYKYAGTIDFICKIEGKLYIGDIKTSKGIYPEQLLQTSAYRSARQEEYPEEKYVGTVIVRVGKDGSFETGGLDDDKTYIMGDGGKITGLALHKELTKAFVSAKKLQITMNRLKDYKPETK